jgi:hypothetical protein
MPPNAAGEGMTGRPLPPAPRRGHPALMSATPPPSDTKEPHQHPTHLFPPPTACAERRRPQSPSGRCAVGLRPSLDPDASLRRAPKQRRRPKTRSAAHLTRPHSFSDDKPERSPGRNSRGTTRDLPPAQGVRRHPSDPRRARDLAHAMSSHTAGMKQHADAMGELAAKLHST